jgi:hypothetical protein
VDEADAHSYVGGMDKIGKHSQPGDNTMRKVRKNVPLMKKIDATRKASMHAGLAKGAEMSLAKDPTDAGDRSKNIARTSGNAATRFARIAKGKAPFQKEEVHLDELNQQTYFNAADKRNNQAKAVGEIGHYGIAPQKKLQDKAYKLNAWGRQSERNKEINNIKKSLSPATKRAVGVRESIEEKVQQLDELSKNKVNDYRDAAVKYAQREGIPHKKLIKRMVGITRSLGDIAGGSDSVETKKKGVKSS